MELVTDLHLRELYRKLRILNLTITDSFYSLIVPISLEYINVFDRNQSIVLLEMMLTYLKLNVESEELWNAMIKKLDEENIYRYIPHLELA